MNTLSVVSLASIVCVLLNIGEPTADSQGEAETVTSKHTAITHPAEDHPECPAPINHTVLGHNFVQSVPNCTCDCGEGKVGWYKNGTPCFALGLGYNKENTSKDGKCYNGLCVLNDIPFGCNGDRYDTLRIPKNDKYGNPPVGCAYTCQVLDERNTTFLQEYGFYNAGIPCRHVMEPGPYSDGPPSGWFNSTYVNGSCTLSGNQTICLPEGSQIPVC